MDLGCKGETSTSFIYSSPCYGTGIGQLAEAQPYLASDVSPITLDIGANDLLNDFDVNTCTVSSTFDMDWHKTLDSNLDTILSPLHNALVAHGHSASDLLVLNYYNPYEQACPTVHRLDTGEYVNSDQLVEDVNNDLAQHVNGSGTLVDIFTPFNKEGNICSYTSVCSSPHPSILAIHPNAKGYRAIADAIEAMYPYH